MYLFIFLFECWKRGYFTCIKEPGKVSVKEIGFGFVYLLMILNELIKTPS